MAELSVDDLLQLHIISEDMSAPAKTRARPLLVLVKKVEGDRVLLALAGKTGGRLPDSPGTPIQLQKPVRNGIVRYEAIIIAVREKRPPAFEVRLLTPGERVQRRAFFRVPVEDEARYTLPQPEPPPGLPGTPQLVLAPKWLKARLRDLSETGASLLVNEPREVGEYLILELPLAPTPISLEGVVRACWAGQNGGKTAVALAIEFLNPSKGQQDRVRRFVFERQRKLRQRRAELREEEDKEGR
jgi:c-di-GMP-binding flagellar brake protein YcgR